MKINKIDSAGCDMTSPRPFSVIELAGRKKFSSLPNPHLSSQALGTDQNEMEDKSYSEWESGGWSHSLTKRLQPSGSGNHYSMIRGENWAGILAWVHLFRGVLSMSMKDNVEQVLTHQFKKGTKWQYDSPSLYSESLLTINYYSLTQF